MQGADGNVAEKFFRQKKVDQAGVGNKKDDIDLGGEMHRAEILYR